VKQDTSLNRYMRKGLICNLFTVHIYLIYPPSGDTSKDPMQVFLGTLICTCRCSQTAVYQASYIWELEVNEACPSSTSEALFWLDRVYSVVSLLKVQNLNNLKWALKLHPPDI